MHQLQWIEDDGVHLQSARSREFHSNESTPQRPSLIMPSNNRRTTLGPIPVNNGGSNGSNRMSIGVPGGKAKLRAGKERQSMAPRIFGGDSLGAGVDSNEEVGTGVAPLRRRGVRKSVGSAGLSAASEAGGMNSADGRRQSVAPPAMAARIDPRPIIDKAFVNSNIKSLVTYLIATGYEEAISHKTLSRPSGKDFNQVITFLLRKIDPNFNDGHAKFEDEVSNFFRALKYPFNISKTALVAVGSPHTWPGLLAALSWLIEVLQCHDIYLATHDSDNDERDQNANYAAKALDIDELAKRGEKQFFSFLLDAYEAFLLGYDKQSVKLEDNLIETFDAVDKRIVSEVERVTDENAGIVEAISHMTNKGNG